MNKPAALAFSANLLAGVAFVLFVLVPAHGEEPVPNVEPGSFWSATPTQAQDKEDFNRSHPNTPVWENRDAASFPNCEAFVEGELRDLIVVRLSGDREFMTFDEAISRNQDNNDNNNVWPIGSC